MDFEIREGREPQGRKKLIRERAAYFRLMQQGVSNTEACRIVGVNRRTGKRWRYGRNPSGGNKAAPPLNAVEPPSVPSRYLREADRIHIADRLREKATVRAIAAELGRSPSTVSREIRRNRHPENDQYRPHAAQARADARRPRAKRGKIGQNPELRAAIQAGLDELWSPEQICHALRRQFPDRPEMHVVHETVYQALYLQGRGDLRRELAGALRSGRARRKPQRQANCRLPRFTEPMVMISDRPAEAEDRAVPGHWEGDLIIGKDNG
ncbi:IS30 family transposase, partial [Streptomyces sp. NPDC094466]|uniref:IS30 family transposase n=1 Tax=Streptomyces sp. NPDC094466 TaxID=3366065 RepID=UPI0038108775